MHFLGDVIRLNAKRFSDRTAVLMEEQRLTFGKLNSKVNQLAHALIELGVKPKDRIAIYSVNSIEWLIVYFAIAKCGACVVPINFRYKEEELAYAINNSESSVIFTDAELRSTIDSAKKSFTIPPQVIAIRGEPRDDELCFSGLIKERPTSEPDLKVNPEWPCCITYTSGTTGVPKGVLTSHNAMKGVWVKMVVEGDVQPHEISILNLPLFHAAGIHMLVAPVFLRGGMVLIMTGRFDPDKVLANVQQYKATLMFWVPTQLAMLVNSPALGKYDISSVKKIWYGSSPIPPPILETSLKRFDASFYQFYGQTELGTSAVLRPEDHYGERAQFTGRESFNADLRIVDENGQDVPIGEVGEIIGRQSALGMICYYGADEATKDTIRDGWIYTGDLARVEKDGYFTIVDRLKDLIISGGENIYPKEIEDLLIRFPGVREVAAFGIPDDVYGESVCAAVVKNQDEDFGEKELIDFCGDRLSGYKKPKKIIFVSELPRNAFGKVTKNSLREPFWAGRNKRV